MVATQKTIDALEEATSKYKYGFVTDIESDKAPKGLSEDTIRFISAKKEEPQWMLDSRLKAFATWQKNGGARLGKVEYPTD
jgi:Fe-S cluster assembly protein SufB